MGTKQPEGSSILLVDDDEDICRNMSDILADLGYQVEVAFDGLAGLELVRRKPFDVALLDLKMPGMDGLTLYHEIKKIRPETGAILVTAYASQAVMDRALGTGVLQVLPKPLDLPHLMQWLEDVLGRPLVLVVDDDSDLCVNLWDLLHAQGYRVGLAHDEQQASTRLDDRSYDVVLIDMRLPDGDGLRVFDKVQKACPGAHTVLITGFSADLGGQVDQLLAKGVDAVHYKPFDVPALLSTLQRLV